MAPVEDRRISISPGGSGLLVGFYIGRGFATLDLVAPLQAFNTLKVVSWGRGYRTALLSFDGEPVSSSDGMAISTQRDLAGQLDTLVVVGGVEAKREDLDAVRSHAAAARRIAGIGRGAFLLGSAGLLDGRRATTHWRQAEGLARCFPAATVESDRSYVRDGPIWTSAGGAAGIDLALALVEQDHGAIHAHDVARHLVADRPADSGTAAEQGAADGGHDRVARALRFARAHLVAPLTVVQLADVACLSPRQFTRTFRARTGETPAGAVERLRVEAARPRVESDSEPITLIGQSVGFSDPERMRRAFIRRFGLSPQAMRRRAEERMRRRLPAAVSSA